MLLLDKVVLLELVALVIVAFDYFSIYGSFILRSYFKFFFKYLFQQIISWLPPTTTASYQLLRKQKKSLQTFDIEPDNIA